MYIAHISDLHIGDPSKPGEENLKRVIGEINRFCVPFDCVLVTGDIGHHEGIDAVARGLAVIDAGHYGIEHIFIKDMKQFLERSFAGVEVITAPRKDPFTVL